MQEKNTLTVLKLITEDIKFKKQKIMENSLELVNAIKEQVLLIESEINKPTAAAKGRCRSAANKIKNLSADFKRNHK